jgi:hypothetical protein
MCCCCYCARRVPLGMCAQMCAKCDSVTGAPDFGQISAKSAQNINNVPTPTKAHNWHNATNLSLSLSLSHTHTHTHTSEPFTMIQPQIFILSKTLIQSNMNWTHPAVCSPALQTHQHTAQGPDHFSTDCLCTRSNVQYKQRHVSESYERMCQRHIFILTAAISYF